VALALACPLLLDAAPAPGTSLCLTGLGLTLTLTARRWRLFPIAVLLLLGAYAFATLERELALRIEDSPAVHPIRGVVSGLPEWHDATLRFRLVAEAGPWGSDERHLEVRWFEAPETPRPGEAWRFDLALASVRGRLNFSGHDPERWALAHGIHGLGRVRGNGAKRLEKPNVPGAALPGLPTLRWNVRERLDAELAGLPGAGLVRALAIGDRSGLTRALQESLRVTGTGHLLAISGLHVGLVALFATGLARAMLAVLPAGACAWPARRLAPLLGLVAAAVYAGLAGFDTSPRRALVMLAVWVAVLVLHRTTSAWRGWWLAVVAVLLLDPFAPLSPGFWLSFGAVAVLFLAFLGIRPVPRGFRGLLRAQTALLPGMLTLGVGWFSTASLGGWFVNLVAIPWVSVVSLPLVLLSLLALPIGGIVSSVLVHMAERSAAYLAQVLDIAQAGLAPLQWTPAAPGGGTLLLAGLGGLLCLAPTGLRLRRFGMALLLPLTFPPPGLPSGAVRIDALDVGQGQATWVTTARHNLLVDPGPGMANRWSLVEGTIVPALREQGRDRPDLVLVSHGDLDHAGGLQDVQRVWPQAPVMGNWRNAPTATAPCHDQRDWRWDGVEFRILHPSPWLPYLGNDSSCVLLLRAPGGRILLPGDIGKHVERRLAERASEPHRLILAPHHGSRSSSSDAFLSWAAPESVILSVGHANRFGLPHDEVLSRYERRGSSAWTTAECGALRVTLWADGRLDARAARRIRSGPWRFPGGANCP
jgi:competence protein ComEC